MKAKASVKGSGGFDELDRWSVGGKVKYSMQDKLQLAQAQATIDMFSGYFMWMRYDHKNPENENHSRASVGLTHDL